MAERWRIGLVVPRFGADVYGGAETHARTLAHALAALGHTVDVLTTTARSALSWLPRTAPGTAVEDGLVVRRFDSEPRDWTTYGRLLDRLEQEGTLGAEDAWALVRAMGRSPALLDYLAAEADRRDWWLFIPYLFATTLEGIHAVPRAVLVPCLHDEPLAALAPVAEAFAAAAAVWYNTPEEAELGLRRFGRPGPVVGIWTEPAEPDRRILEDLRPRGLPPRYLLYVGRLEHGKGVGELFAWHRALAEAADDAPALVAVGEGPVEPDPDAAVVFRRAPPAVKHALYAGALALVLPSVRESLSLVLLEAWQHGLPVLVRAGSPVTTGHVRRSGGGLVVDGPATFAAAVLALVRRPRLRAALGAAGRRYVAARWSPAAVKARLRAALAALS
jgi:glycosyltransferase involved in cell wall biosynthesis